MRRVNTAIKSQALIWEFAPAVGSTPSNGAIGVYPTPISIPVTAVIYDINLIVQTGIVGGAAASFSLDWAGNAAIYSFGNVVPIGGYLAGPFTIPAVTKVENVILNILANTFTAGKFILVFTYIDSSNR